MQLITATTRWHPKGTNTSRRRVGMRRKYYYSACKTLSHRPLEYDRHDHTKHSAQHGTGAPRTQQQLLQLPASHT